MTQSITLGEKIKFHRTMKGLTQKQLGDMTGIHEVSIRKYELNKTTPKKEQLLKIANCLGVPYNEFLELKITTDSDILPLMFAIDEVFKMDIISSESDTYGIRFKNKFLNYFLQDWQSVKALSEAGQLSDEDYRLWKLMRSSYTKVAKD